MSKALASITGMSVAADLLELASAYLDSASMDVMDMADDKMGHAFMGSLTASVQVIDALRSSLASVIRDVEVDQGLRQPGGSE